MNNAMMRGFNAYRSMFRPLLFRLDPETAHRLTVEACRIAGIVPGLSRLARWCFEFNAPELEIDVAGLRFASPLGLAAGWDKNAKALPMIDSLGFGFTEAGSVSASPSKGNPKPRLFRIPTDRAVVVNYGLPNDGAEAIATRLASHQPKRRPGHPLGINIVKTNDGPGAPASREDDILDDYVCSITLLHQFADYIMLNLSCPNASGGKDYFAQAGSVQKLLERVAPLNITCPVFLKIAPNPNQGFLDQVISESEPFAMVRGFSFNLPAGRPKSLQIKSQQPEFQFLPGAISGPPVARLMNSCIRELYGRISHNRFCIIASGGISTAEDAYEKIRLGASLLQLYTAMIYEGPGVVRAIQQGLVRLLQRDGIKHIREAIGTLH